MSDTSCYFVIHQQFLPYHCHIFAITTKNMSKICLKFTFSTSANTLIDLSGNIDIFQWVQKVTSQELVLGLFRSTLFISNPSCLFCFKKLVSVGTNRSNVKFTVVIWHSFSGLITILSQNSTAYLYLTLFFKMLNV